MAGRSIPLQRLGSAVPVEPGSISVHVTAPGMQEVTRELQLAAGENKSLAVSLMPEPEEEAPPPAKEEAEARDRPTAPEPAKEEPSTSLRTAVLVVGAVGVAGVATFAITGAMAGRKYSTLEDECGDSRCTRPAMQDVVDKGRTLQTVANVSLIVGAVGLVAGGTMVYFGWPSETAGQPQTAGLALDLGANGVAVRYAARF